MPLEPGNQDQRRYPPDDPREWLNRARSNLKKAQIASGADGIYYEDLCFDAQQAAEKAIKAVLISRQIEFPYVHDLAELLDLVERSGLSVPSSVREAARLTRYAVMTRYPGALDPVTRQDYEAAVTTATAVLGWAADLVATEHPGGR
jgi:HEPN domain-containing protein